MMIREYRSSDCGALSKLFYQTVHSVCSKDYDELQLSAWADNEDSLLRKCKDLSIQHTLIAEIDGRIVGFGSMDAGGCLDLLFVHKDCQNMGIATALCNELEKGFAVIKTYASLTAKSFFEKRGYVVVREQEIERAGHKLTNFEMQKLT